MESRHLEEPLTFAGQFSLWSSFNWFISLIFLQLLIAFSNKALTSETEEEERNCLLHASSLIINFSNAWCDLTWYCSFWNNFACGRKENSQWLQWLIHVCGTILCRIFRSFIYVFSQWKRVDYILCVKNWCKGTHVDGYSKLSQGASFLA